jgi:hypothetical protein
MPMTPEEIQHLLQRFRTNSVHKKANQPLERTEFDRLLQAFSATDVAEMEQAINDAFPMNYLIKADD